MVQMYAKKVSSGLNNFLSICKKWGEISDGVQDMDLDALVITKT